MLFIDTQTLDGSFFEHESARHDAWTGFATDTAVLMTGEGCDERFWLALSKGQEDTLFAGYGTTDQTEWNRLPEHPNIPGRLLSEGDTADFWQIHQSKLSQADCTLAMLKLLGALHGRSGKTAVKTDGNTGKSLMIVTNSALNLFEEQNKHDSAAALVAPSWAKINYFLNPPDGFALYGGTAVWCAINRPDLVLVMQHQPGGNSLGTVFSTVTGYSTPLVSKEDNETDEICLRLDCTNLNGTECQPSLSKLIQGNESDDQIAFHVKKLYEAYQNQGTKVHKDLSAENVAQGKSVKIMPTQGDGLELAQTGLIADVEVLRSRV